MGTRLKTLSRWSAAVAVLATVAGVFGGAPALAGIKDSKHNLGSQQSAAGANEFAGTGEICVFCHTPHAADTAAKIPLWNRSASPGASYTTYNSLGTLSLDGGTAAVGSTSVACLSCHDGVQAMNTVINAPGSGKTGDAAWVNGLAGTGWTGNNQTDGKMKGLAAVSADTESLKNDHPIGIQYAGGPGSGKTIPAAPTTYDQTRFKDPDFKDALSTTLGGAQVWWVETGGAGRQKTDLPLYARTGTVTFTDGTTANIADPQPFVECASCHDPHSSTTNTFLRVNNTDSAVCLACHDK